VRLDSASFLGRIIAGRRLRRSASCEQGSRDQARHLNRLLKFASRKENAHLEKFVLEGSEIQQSLKWGIYSEIGWLHHDHWL